MKNIFYIHKTVNKVDVYRIHDWFYYLGFTILGSLISNETAGISWPILVVCFFALAFIYALNDFTDYEGKHPFFIYPLLLLIVCGNLISFKQWIPLAIFLILQIAYSVKPIRLKKFPVIGTLCCMFAFPQIFLIGYVETADFDLRSFLVFLLLVLLSGVAQLIHEIDDMEEDTLAGIRTSAIFYGKTIINYVCMVLLILGIVINFVIYILQIIGVITFFAMFTFQLYIITEISLKGITNKIRFRFRLLGLFVGGVWFASMIL